MEFIKDQKRKTRRCRDKFLFEWTRQQEFQHHIVCKDDVWRIVDNELPFILGFLTGVFGKANGLFTFCVSFLQKLSQFPILAVTQRIHRIDDNGLYTASGTSPQHMVNNRHDIRETLA